MTEGASQRGPRNLFFCETCQYSTAYKKNITHHLISDEHLQRKQSQVSRPLCDRRGRRIALYVPALTLLALQMRLLAGALVETAYGVCSVVAEREDGMVVVQPTDWLLSDNNAPTFFIRKEELGTSFEPDTRWREDGTAPIDVIRQSFLLWQCLTICVSRRRR